MLISQQQILAWLKLTAEVLEQNKDYLTGLDAEIGDADHGINMCRGFSKVMAQLPSFGGKDIGAVLKATGMALISSVGGAAGPLYGTLFVRAAAVADGKLELSADELGKLLSAGLEGVIQRGRASPGDKTMVDALHPAVCAYEKACQAGATVAEALSSAVEAAQQGMVDTVPLLAKKGRASYLGERSIGHQDPGATSSYLMLRALHSVVANG